MSEKLQQFETELRAEHDALTKTFESAQITAEAEWAKYEVARVALTTFRAKYGRVLKALATKSVTVEEAK